MATITSTSPITKSNGVSVNTTYIQSKNCTVQSSRDVKYIVMHYTGNTSDNAISNAKYFYNNSIQASAHYFVDNNSIYQSVALKNRAWHCGASTYFHGSCRNTNSIGIEMCTSGNYTVSETTINMAVKLCGDLCKLIGITANTVDTYVLRHYDVTHKQCPLQWASSNSQGFTDFKTKVKNYLNGAQETPVHWGEPFKKKLISAGIISDDALWSKYDEYVTKCQAAALIDKCTGGTWESNEVLTTHWVNQYITSLSGKNVITDTTQWISNPDAWISKGLILALIDKATNGTLDKYANRQTEHWANNNLDSLCDKGIIETPDAWKDYDGTVTKASLMAIIVKAFNI